jgi:hypothetical protein
MILHRVRLSVAGSTIQSKDIEHGSYLLLFSMFSLEPPIN